MDIAVTTPTGHVGSRVVQLLLQAGVRPIVLVRDPARLAPEVRERVEVRVGDLADAPFVREATRNVQAVFWVDPTDFAADDPNAVTERLGGNLCAAVVDNAIPRVVFQSSVGAERRHGAGLIDGLARVEEMLDATGAAVLHLRCGYFFTNLLGALEDLRRGVLSTAMPATVAMPWVAPRDIGEIVAARLLSAAWSDRQVQAVHGPADLTFADVVAVLSEVTGREIRLQRVSDQEEHSKLLAAGLSATAAAGVVGMTQGLRDHFTAEQPRSVLTTTPTTLSEWAGAQLRPLLAPPHQG